MGIGLPISRAIIEAHQRRIWAETNATTGATLRFTLRWRKNQVAEEAPAA